MQNWGPFLASHGIVCMTIGTNNIFDLVNDRKEALQDALISLKAENTRVNSPLFNKLNTSRVALAGWSMGGGGAQLAAVEDSTIKAIIALCPWIDPMQISVNSLIHDVPVLFFSGQFDAVAPASTHANIHYNYTPSTTDKLIYEISSGGHTVANAPSGGQGEVGRMALSWLKKYLIKDSCYCPLLLDTPLTASEYDASCIAPVYGCTDATALNYYPGANIDDGNCCFVSGCTDPLYTEYDALACIDDGSCATLVNSGSCNFDSPTGAYTSELIHDRVTITWDNMNDANCMVDQYRIRYREVGTSAWSSKTMAGSGLCIFGLNTTSKKILGLTASTTYEYYMKAWYCGGSSSAWSAIQNFTTADECQGVINFAVTSPTTTKASFTWDTTAAYSFARIKLRPDTTGGVWTTAGGFGVFYPALTKDKNGLTPGQTYRASSRTWCDPTGGTYRSSGWTSPIFWTQPTSIRVEGGSAINNLSVYPNPSRDIFNVSFTSVDKQDLRVRILNIIGEELINENLEQFIGEYTKQIDLTNNAKGVYFLEIETNDGVINKKLILQ